MDWTQTNVLITGASGAIGRRLAVHYAAKAGGVLLTGRDKGRLEGAVRDAGAANNVASLTAGLRNVSDIERIVERAREHFGRIDLLIHNAADVTSKPFVDTTPDEIASLIETNLTAPLQLTRLALPLLRQSAAPKVVTVSSLAGFKANIGQTVYSVSKAGLNAMADALRAELRAEGIQCINLALSSVAVEDPPRPGQVPVNRVIDRLDHAIEHGHTEVFFSPITKFLMRTYAAFPKLKTMRSTEG